MKNEGKLVYRASVATRITHWLFFLAFMALISSGLQIFNAAPYLDAANKSTPSKRVLSIGSPMDGLGTTTIFGHQFTTTGYLGWTDDGMGGKAPRAFPAWLTIPAYQDLADGRRWHFFFAWLMVLCGIVYIAAGVFKGNLTELILRPRDIPRLLPMQLYYLRLRKTPPEHGTYNPLQKLAYTLTIFVFAPIVILSGLALSPGLDAWVHPLTVVFGGRQFARLWHFIFMLALVGFFATHLVLVATQGAFNQLRSMITGWYRLRPQDGTGV